MKISMVPALLLSLPFAVQAEETPENLDTIQVTASKMAEDEEESLASVTILTREDIERLQATTLLDLLKGAAGISISNYGGPGKLSSLFMRGTESDHTLVLIDSIRAGSATSGTTAIQDIPLELVERVEIVRGTRSSLYGSEAIGGVIQVFTRKGEGDFRPDFSLGMGSYNSLNASAGFSGSTDTGWFSARLNHNETDGFNACRGNPFPNGAGCFTFEPDKDGYTNQSLALSGGMAIGEKLEAELRFMQASGETDFDGSWTNQSETLTRSLAGKLAFQASENWHSTLTAGQSLDESDSFLNGSYMSTFNTERSSLNWQNDVMLDSATVNIGLDWYEDSVDSTTPYDQTSRDNSALYAQYSHSFGDTRVKLATRFEDNEQYGEHSTGQLAIGHSFAGMLFSASAGTAFRAPSFNELYYPGFSNPNLLPEESTSFEIALSGGNALSWKLNAYSTTVKELVAFDFSTYLPGNLAEARITGLEARVGATAGSWNINSQVSLLKTENRDGGFNHGNELPRRAGESLRIDADRPFGNKHLFGTTVVYTGKRFDDLGNFAELDAYTTVDLRWSYKLGKAWKIQGKLVNAFDTDYETAAWYEQAGRSLYLTLRYQP